MVFDFQIFAEKQNWETSFMFCGFLSRIIPIFSAMRSSFIGDFWLRETWRNQWKVQFPIPQGEKKEKKKKEKKGKERKKKKRKKEKGKKEKKEKERKKKKRKKEKEKKEEKKKSKEEKKDGSPLGGQRQRLGPRPFFFFFIYIYFFSPYHFFIPCSYHVHTMVHPMGSSPLGLSPLGYISPIVGARKSTPNPAKVLTSARWGGLGSGNRDYWFFFFFAFFKFSVFAWHRILGTPYYDLIVFHFFFRCSLCTFCGMRSKIFFVKFHFRCFWIFEFCWKRNLQWRTLRFVQFCRAWFRDFVTFGEGFFQHPHRLQHKHVLCYAMPCYTMLQYARLCYTTRLCYHQASLPLGVVTTRLCVNCQVSSVKCQVSSVECQVWSVKCQVSSVKCQVSSAKCQVSSVKCHVSSVKCQVSSIK